MAWRMLSGMGGAQLGNSWVTHVFTRRQAPGSCPRILASKSCNDARVSAARPHPSPVRQRCSMYSMTNGPNKLRRLGNSSPSSLRKARKRFKARSYRMRVAGWTVSPRRLPSLCLSFALYWLEWYLQVRALACLNLVLTDHRDGLSAGFRSVCT